MSEQDREKAEGCCHPAVLRIEHKWSDLADRTGLMKMAIGELSGQGIRYQDTV